MGGDSVHVGDTLGSQGLAHGNRGLFLGHELGSSDEAGLFQLNQAVADVLASGHSGVFSAGAVVLLATVVLAKTVDSDLLSDVQLVGNRGGTVVKPVAVIGRELLEAGSLSVLSPL